MEKSVLFQPHNTMLIHISRFTFWQNTTKRLMIEYVEETIAKINNGKIIPWSGFTDLFITPGFRFNVVDILITNFHLPKSTLLMLISAFHGRKRVFKSYEYAIRQKYRFFSYGDSCIFSKENEKYEKYEKKGDDDEYDIDASSGLILYEIIQEMLEKMFRVTLNVRRDISSLERQVFEKSSAPLVRNILIKKKKEAVAP